MKSSLSSEARNEFRCYAEVHVYREYHASVKFIGEETCRNLTLCREIHCLSDKLNKFDINIHAGILFIR